MLSPSKELLRLHLRGRSSAGRISNRSTNVEHGPNSQAVPGGGGAAVPTMPPGGLGFFVYFGLRFMSRISKEDIERAKKEEHPQGEFLLSRFTWERSLLQEKKTVWVSPHAERDEMVECSVMTRV